MVRLAMPLLFAFSPSVTEAHVRDQFTLLYLFISLVYLVLSVFLLKAPIKRYKEFF